MKKTNKSGLNAIVNQNASQFELWLNRDALQHVAAGASKNEVNLTLTYIPGSMPEELFARCDANAPGRVTLACVMGMTKWLVFLGYTCCSSFGCRCGRMRRSCKHRSVDCLLRLRLPLAEARQTDLKENVLIDDGRLRRSSVMPTGATARTCMLSFARRMLVARLGRCRFFSWFECTRVRLKSFTCFTYLFCFLASHQQTGNCWFLAEKPKA